MVAVSLTACAALWLQVTPSVFTQEMLQSTEERLGNTTEVHPPRILESLDMTKTTHQKVKCCNTSVASELISYETQDKNGCILLTC